MSVITSTESIVNSISEAYLMVAQETSQYLYNEQILNIDCNPSGTSSPCVDCIKATKKIFDDRKESITQQRLKEICKNPCTCNVSNINMSQTISINFQSFMEANSKQEFVKQVTNSFYSKASQTGTNLFPTDQRNETIQKAIENLYTKMASKTVQESLQGLKTLQIINVRGPANVSNIDITSAIDYVSMVLMKTDTLQQDITDIQTSMIALTMQILDVSLAQLIYRIVQIVIIIVMLMALGFIINMSFTVYGLYVR